MASKSLTIFIVAFWAVMMTALVRTEFFPRRLTMAPVPIEQVVKRLFANHETQRLSVTYQDKTIGTCELTVSPRAKLAAPESTPLTGPPEAYQVQAYVNLRLQVFGLPSRFGLNSRSWFDGRYDLRNYNLTTELGVNRIEIQGDNDTKMLAMKYNLGDGPQSHQFSYDQLKDPAALQSLGLPGTGLPITDLNSASKLLPAIHAYEDWIEISGSKQHAFLVECMNEDNPGLWAKIWIDDRGNLLTVKTSLGVTMSTASMENFAGQSTKSKSISQPRRLQ